MENGSQSERNRQTATPHFIMELRENRLLFSGALGVSIVAFMGLLQFSSKELDTALAGSLICFIVSVPINAMSVYLTTLAIERVANIHFRRAFLLISIMGLTATFGGLACLFWHFSCLAGVSFLGISLAATVFAFLERSRHG
jgi:hypothetical protein